MSADPSRPAADLAAAVRAGDVSPVALVEASLDRIAESDLNAFVTVCAERAREHARERERVVNEEGAVGPLHGVPVAVKDLTDVAGVRTTYGSACFRENVPGRSATAVDRLERAGAVVVGKTNTPEFGRKTTTDNPAFGTTTNPWDRERTAGGSSGGSAAALAAGLVPLATGTDAAGSLRIPAAACGVCGLMADFGRVPQGPDRADAYHAVQPHTFVGPLARTVDDLALALDVLAGPDRHDPYARPAPEAPYRDDGSDVSGVEIGYSPDLDVCAVDPAVERTVREAVDRLGDAGATSREVAVFDGWDWASLHDPLVTLLRTRYVGMWEDFRDRLGVDLLTTDERVTPEVVSRITAGLDLHVRDHQRASRARTRAFDDVSAVFEDVDALLAPTLAVPPFPVDESPPTVGGIDHPMHGWVLTWPFNLTGHPALSVPVGAVDGLPVGVQVVAARGDDRTALRVGRAVERATGWPDRLPVDAERR